MGRPKRVTAGGLVYHVLNRGNRRARIFLKPQDYAAFLDAIVEGLDRHPTEVLGLCLMPNHWHLVLCPKEDGDLTRFVGWVTNTHVKRYRQHYEDKVGGHLYQGRFKSFPVQNDSYLLTVLRYVEANPLRCGLGLHAEDWPWSSFSLREKSAGSFLSPWPVARPVDWKSLVEARWSEPELAQIRRSADRGSPFGEAGWAESTAIRLALQSTLRAPGRPPR
jgi:putative transposase